jgi:hypothetical protein
MQVPPGFEFPVSSCQVMFTSFPLNSILNFNIKCILFQLRETGAELGRSSRIASGMIMRSMQHRLILFGVAAVFVIVIVLSIYFTVSKYT